MNLLALDFSTAQRVVCVSTDAGKEAVCTTTDRTAGPLGLITAALEKAGITREEIDTIAVGLGPGSYTGIRSSIALAQGFQLGTNVQLAGISSADIIAHSSNLVDEFAVVIDAQRGEFHCGKYCRQDDTIQALDDLCIAPPETLKKLDCPIVGPDVERLLGQGSDVFPDPSTLARVARENASFTPGHELEPIYLRPPEFKKAPPARHID